MLSCVEPIELTEEEQAIYQWQMWVPGFGEQGQQALRNTTVFISRVGGLGSVVAYELAAAGVGRMVLAHAGNIKYSDLNRQLLMTYDGVGVTERVHSAEQRLKQLNPRLEIVSYPENANIKNISKLMDGVDIVIDCAPLFQERFAMNQEAVKQGIPLIECAMYSMEAQITTIIPGKTPCLSCIYPVEPPHWKREFPVIGATSGTVGCMAAMEAIKLITGVGNPLTNTLLTMDLASMEFRRWQLQRRANCDVCSIKQ
ncbi:HesA/MoeB/ThiF family protein [Endozoicomonas sp. SM1973]|uniref:HesA/MoeB/ThiF family protein n=1 Tax=Spartinivicinus marinus TaxID=2994442 RepID=A0A853I2P2_9GAMM|nr:HesA/MoeB/ThiF family protein [Spartinivicinus marinus]MCX4026640.1 HesA/MoeB/ThiF family protein [Spartinivicinus marinus]NYZ64474.1 HesA/MoeB/ThiF family protein [Spartinivicinus marinus]